MQPNELLEQLSTMIVDVERLRGDAEKWQTLLRTATNMGYGPQLTPEAVASLLPHPGIIAGIVTASQEVPTATSAPKRVSKRRNLTESDREQILALRSHGESVAAISDAVGVTQSAVYSVVGGVAP